MESPLSFNSTENFRKKLLLRNLKPYKVDDSFVADQNVNTREFQIVDYSVVDSPNVEDIGNIQEASLYPLNKYGPTNTNSTYGNTVQINLNLNTQSNFGTYWYSDSIGSKLELIGDIQENLLFVKNLYGPTQFTTSYGDTVNINQTFGINTNLGVYGYPKTINSKLEQIGNNQEIALIVKNIYKPQLSSGDYGTTKWSINNDLVVLTNGSGLYGPSTAINSRLNQIGN